MAKTALIVGVTGQDGAYLARLLVSKGYTVHGTSRDAELARLDGLIALGVRDRVQLHSVSPADFCSVAQAIKNIEPDEIYNLSGQSSVALSFTQPIETIESIALGTLNVHFDKIHARQFQGDPAAIAKLVWDCRVDYLIHSKDYVEGPEGSTVPKVLFFR